MVSVREGRPRRLLRGAVVITTAVVVTSRFFVSHLKQSFVPPPMTVLGRPLSATPGKTDSLGALLTAVSLIGLPTEANAEREAPDASVQINQFVKTVWSMLTTGSDGVYNDPTTPEGAKALGLVNPLPKDIQDVTIQDLIPGIAIFSALLGWGLLAVPSAMDRSDGAKSVLFPSQVPALPPMPVSDAVKKLSAEAPIIKRKKLKAPEEEMLLPESAKKRKSPTKFGRNAKASSK
eukprot:TRINITY_DN798_c2_g1_i1.p1 TRINITY_DN798_c2_g1~~TRINITY_DN798_c2_g1_i1.p1  ORF type:complete len:252 (-),score=34.20 TRINITY_DN798_c2_g1_i1:197-898(-)